MNAFLHIIGRELRSYFNSPIAYCFIVVFLLVTCGLFMTTFFLAGVATMRPFFSSLPLILIIFESALTMRLWAEERKNGTLPLLFSLPTKSTALVLGKYLSAFIFSLLALASTLVIPVMLIALGRPDVGPILGGYLGAVLLIAFLLAMGMSISAFFKDQIVAFIISLVAGFACFLAGLEFISAFIDGWVPGLGTFLRDTIGIGSHFNSFSKGVIDLSDFLYFFSFAVIFLIINVFTLEGYLRYKAQRGFTLGCILLVATGVLINGILRDVNIGRVDLTEEKIFTVSPATKRVFERLKVPIKVTYYVSPKEKLPTPMKDMPRDVADILEELSRLSPKFSYKIVHPEDVPDQIEDLHKKGITPFSAQTIEQDALNIKRIYSAISVGYLDKKEEIIPQVVPDSLGSLEYDLVSKIYRLTLPKKPRVFLVTPSSSVDPKLAAILRQAGRPVPDQDRFTRIVQILESQGYEVVKHKITKETPIPDDVNLIMLIAPERLEDRARYEIYRRLREGIPLFVAGQSYTYAYSEGPNGPEIHAQKTSTAINAILEPFGIKIGDKMLFDTRHVTLHVTTQRQIGMFTALVQTPVNYPVQIEILPDQMNSSLSITNSISGLLYLWGSPLVFDDSLLKKAGLKKTILFTTSPGAWEREFHFGALTQQDLTPPPADKLVQLPLAALLEGTFPNPFQGKEVPKWEADKDSNSTDTKEGQEGGEARPGKLFVIGCSEMFSDSAIMAMGNPVFLLNTVDALSLGEELIHIRNKTQVQRFIRPVSPQEKLAWRIFTIFLMPVLWSLYGVFRAARRRKNRIDCKDGR